MKKHDGVEEIVIPTIKEVKKVYNPRGARDRRISALKRLESQLVKKTKSACLWNDTQTSLSIVEVPLLPKDIERIKKEIQILKTRIN